MIKKVETLPLSTSEKLTQKSLVKWKRALVNLGENSFKRRKKVPVSIQKNMKLRQGLLVTRDNRHWGHGLDSF